MNDIRQAIIDYLMAERSLSPEAIERARAVAERSNQSLENVLNQLGQLSDNDMARAYAHVSGAPLWEPATEPPLLDAEEIGLGAEFLRKVRALPLRLEGDVLIVAACDPFDQEMRHGLRFATGRELELRVARLGDFRALVDPAALTQSKADIDERRVERDMALVEDSSADGLAVELVSQAFAAAVERGASDIHFEPRRHDLLVRLRIDGRLVEYRSAPADVIGPCVSRIKVLSNLNVGERRLPQDGRASFVNAGRAIDVRVATAPTVFGESAVLRLLDRTQAPQDMASLGLPPDVETLLRRALRAPHGLFLVTGPTGSGKTTTLYALLEAFKGSGKKILSVEDPVERHFEHVAQTQIHTQIGLDFANCLRAFLRQDPDVILVGEIRDRETAVVAVQAAMTGHLVLASVHANTALAVAPRLLDMGIEPYQLAAALKGSLAQRLVRRLCPDCKQPTVASKSLTLFARRFGVAVPEAPFEAVGCTRCRGLGFAGRLALAEGFWADDDMLALLGSGASLDALKVFGRSRGFISMAHEGVRQIALGQTTLDEVMAVAEDVAGEEN